MHLIPYEANIVLTLVHPFTENEKKIITNPSHFNTIYILIQTIYLNSLFTVAWMRCQWHQNHHPLTIVP